MASTAETPHPGPGAGYAGCGTAPASAFLEFLKCLVGQRGPALAVEGGHETALGADGRRGWERGPVALEGQAAAGRKWQRGRRLDGLSDRRRSNLAANVVQRGAQREHRHVDRRAHRDTQV